MKAKLLPLIILSAITVAEGASRVSVPVTLPNGRVEYALLDTGATTGHIAPEIMKDLVAAGKARKIRTVTMILADDSKIQTPMYVLSEIRIGGCIYKDVQAVAHGSGVSIGMNILRQNKLVVFHFQSGMTMLDCTNETTNKPR